MFWLVVLIDKIVDVLQSAKSYSQHIFSDCLPRLVGRIKKVVKDILFVKNVFELAVRKDHIEVAGNIFDKIVQIDVLHVSRHGHGAKFLQSRENAAKDDIAEGHRCAALPFKVKSNCLSIVIDYDVEWRAIQKIAW